MSNAFINIPKLPLNKKRREKGIKGKSTKTQHGIEEKTRAWWGG